MPPDEIRTAALDLQDAVAEAQKGLTERALFVELIALAAVAGEHVLCIGPPGTAKSVAVRNMARAIGGRTFEYLLGRFTEPSEIYGPVDLRRLKEGVVETATSGMLPEADVAFLDEVFLGSTAILNTLLGLLNERIFVRGHTRVRCPLRVCVGASNALPDDPMLSAFADRFLLRIFVDPIPDAQLEELLDSGWTLEAPKTPRATGSRLPNIDRLHAALPSVEVDHVRSLLAEALRVLRSAGLVLSDRRAVKAQKLIAAAALVDGRTRATEVDLWPLVYAVPERDGQLLAQEALRELLVASASNAFPHAAESASAGQAARGRRLEQAGQALLDDSPPEEDIVTHRQWRRKIEGVLREVDTAFLPADMPDSLTTIRTALVEANGGAG